LSSHSANHLALRMPPPYPPRSPLQENFLHFVCPFELKEEFEKEVQAYLEFKNKNPKPINWQFTNEKARIKLKSLYPSI
jgi:hypothetical protein